MVAKDGVLYALIENDIVVQIFDSEQLREWDEQTIKAIEIKDGQNVSIGTRYDSNIGDFLEKSLQEVKEELILDINFFYEREVSYMQGKVTRSEINTYETQRIEANNLLMDSNAETPFLDRLAEQRGMDRFLLAKKIVDKNKAYNERLAKLLGYKQSLIKQVENATTKVELENIKYISPLSESSEKEKK